MAVVALRSCELHLFGRGVFLNLCTSFGCCFVGLMSDCRFVTSELWLFGEHDLWLHHSIFVLAMSFLVPTCTQQPIWSLVVVCEHALNACCSCVDDLAGVRVVFFDLLWSVGGHSLFRIHIY